MGDEVAPEVYEELLRHAPPIDNFDAALVHIRGAFSGDQARGHPEG